MAGITRRALLLGSGAALGAAGVHYLGPKLPSLDGTISLVPKGDPGTLNDASGLSETPVFRHTTLSQDPGDAFVQAIQAEIQAAAQDGRAVNVGAARHSMGGQAIPRDGHALTFDNGFVEMDAGAKTFRVHAGARWSQVIAKLDPAGFSPKVMQSNNDFGVAATFCVNAHGWPARLGPMGSTVKSFKMVMADGQVITCSRDDNRELFELTMGGYGLTGILAELEVEMVENKRLTPVFETMPSEDFGARFGLMMEDATVNMAYGRLNVSRDSFLEEALMVTYREARDQSDLPAPDGYGVTSEIARRIYRAQLGNELVKDGRWWIETALAPRILGEATRNALINEPVSNLENRTASRTDILHEYFVPLESFNDFLIACREIIPSSFQEFLNVTLRYVDTDRESLLAYASVPRIAAVMSFSQEMTARGEADMKRMTRALIDRVIELRGTYYLPYRLHASLEQFSRCYPEATQFTALKRAIDPDLSFRNALWDTYLENL